jgi:hypothetical protein
MSRRQRQLDELRRLCTSGAVARALDLAFAHFADFGRNDDIVALLAEIVGRTERDDGLRARLEELSAV